MKVLIFDTETTGLPKNMNLMPTLDTLSHWPHIVQFSFILYDTYTSSIDFIRDSIIRLPDGIKISEQSTKIHGITNEISISKGILLENILNDFMFILEKADLVVAHNIEFDKKVLIAEVLRKYKDIDSNSNGKWTYYYNTLINCKKYYCTMQESMIACNRKRITKDGEIRIKFPTLSETHMHFFEYIPKNLHNSLNDIIVCLRCFHMMKFQKDICKENKFMGDMMKQLE